MSVTDIVRQAIENTPPDYLQSCAAQRAGAEESHLGSYYPDLTAEQVLEKLKGVEWENFRDPNIQDPARGYIAKGFSGMYNMLHIDEIGTGPTEKLKLVDPKKTGFVECTCDFVNHKAQHDDDTIVIIGEHEGKDVVFTFYPGPVISPCELSAEEYDGRELTVTEAKELGIEWVKAC